MAARMSVTWGVATSNSAMRRVRDIDKESRRRIQFGNRPAEIASNTHETTSLFASACLLSCWYLLH